MKTLFIAFALIFLVSCSKEATVTQPTNQKVYLRVESVSPTGETIYSPITVVTIK